MIAGWCSPLSSTSTAAAAETTVCSTTVCVTADCSTDAGVATCLRRCRLIHHFSHNFGGQDCSLARTRPSKFCKLIARFGGRRDDFKRHFFLHRRTRGRNTNPVAELLLAPCSPAQTICARGYDLLAIAITHDHRTLAIFNVANHEGLRNIFRGRGNGGCDSNRRCGLWKRIAG